MRVLVLLLAFVLGAGGALAQVPIQALHRKEAGNQFLKQRQYSMARDQYLAALQLAPNYSDAHYNLGVIYFFRLQDYPRALVHFVKYARLEPHAEDLSQVKSLSIQALEQVEAADRRDYAAALQDGSAAALNGYLSAHPGSEFEAVVQRRLQALGQ